MVLLHIKNSDEHQFLFQCSIEDDVSHISASLVTIYNLRMQIGRLKMEGTELAKYGPAKPVDK